MSTPANSFTPSSTTSLHPRPSPSPISISSRFKKGVWGYRFQLLKLHCASLCNIPTSESESGYESDARKSLLSLNSSSSPSTLVSKGNECSSAYKWCSILGGIGFLETGYLTYLKITDSVAFCPMGGDSCSAILTTDHSSVLGAPLPLFGMLAYGLVTILGLRLQPDHKRAFGIEKINGEMVLIGTMTSMAAASAYFLYILGTEYVGESCSFYLASVALSFSLLFLTLKNFGLDKIQQMVGSKLCLATLLFIALSTSCYVALPVLPSLAGTELPYVEKEVTKESSPLSLSLAKHLQSIGAKLYGAFWCSHCEYQKQMFGREAAKLLDIIECYPDGVKEGTKIAKACSDLDLQYFPSWEINGQVHTGVKQLPELAKLSGFKLDD